MHLHNLFSLLEDYTMAKAGKELLEDLKDAARYEREAGFPGETEMQEAADYERRTQGWYGARWDELLGMIAPRYRDDARTTWGSDMLYSYRSSPDDRLRIFKSLALERGWVAPEDQAAFRAVPTYYQDPVLKERELERIRERKVLEEARTRILQAVGKANLDAARAIYGSITVEGGLTEAPLSWDKLNGFVRELVAAKLLGVEWLSDARLSQFGNMVSELKMMLTNWKNKAINPARENK